MSEPPPDALAAVVELAGPIAGTARLRGGQHADTWLVDAARRSVVVREFPPGDPAAAREREVVELLDGLGGLAPILLAADLEQRWTVISRLDGDAEITPDDPDAWARELGRGLAAVQALPAERVARLPRVPGAPDGDDVLVHSDYWSGNVVFRDGRLAGIVDWPGAGRGPRGYDVAWCRLDLVLLHDARVADVFLTAYEQAAGRALPDVAAWDAWALERSAANVTTWEPNYAPLGRPDLTATELRRRHSAWMMSRTGRPLRS